MEKKEWFDEETESNVTVYKSGDGRLNINIAWKNQNVSTSLGRAESRRLRFILDRYEEELREKDNED